jgi:hypothetical protein
MLKSDRIDIIVYGHSHRSQNKVIKNIFSIPEKPLTLLAFSASMERRKGI